MAPQAWAIQLIAYTSFSRAITQCFWHPTSTLSQSLVTPTSLAKLFINPRVLSESSEALVPITTILIPVADCVLLLHQLVMGASYCTFMYRTTCITLNVSQTECAVWFQLEFKPGSLVRRTSSLPTKPSVPADLSYNLLFFSDYLIFFLKLPKIEFSDFCYRFRYKFL